MHACSIHDNIEIYKRTGQEWKYKTARETAILGRTNAEKRRFTYNDVKSL